MAWLESVPVASSSGEESCMDIVVPNQRWVRREIGLRNQSTMGQRDRTKVKERGCPGLEGGKLGKDKQKPV